MNECLCYPRQAMKHEPIRREWVGNTVWATYPPCPEHDESFITPEWDRRVGRLSNEETAVVQTAA